MQIVPKIFISMKLLQIYKCNKSLHNIQIYHMKIQAVVLLALIFILGASLRMSSSHLQNVEAQVQASGILSGFWEESTPEEQKLAQKILKDRKDLLKAWKKDQFTPEQESEIIDLLIENDEFRGHIVAQMSQDPQMSWIADLEKDEQIAEIKNLFSMSQSPNMEDSISIILADETMREQFINQIASSSPAMAKIKDLSREKQDKLFSILFDPELMAFFIGVGMESQASVAHQLKRKIQHQLHSYHSKHLVYGR